MCAWIKSFLQGRQQRVKVGDAFSSWIDVVSGVPEGSVFGPILYDIYVNDMPSVVKFCQIVMYADDARVYIPGNVDNGHGKMVADLENIARWAHQWQLNLNLKKCAVVHMGHNNLKFTYTLNNFVLQSVTQFNDLGITVDQSLNFNFYVDTIVSRAYRMCYTILNGFYSQSKDFMMSLYKTYVRPILEYNSVIWSPSFLKYIDKYERAQKFCNVPYLTRLEQLNIHTIEE
jgi:hypothetical protein